MSSPLLSERVAAATSRRDWVGARDALLGADVLDAAGHEALGLAYWWLGDVNEAIRSRHLAFEAYDASCDAPGTARVALLLSEDNRRQARGAVADSWRRRAAHLLDGVPACLEHGYLWLYEGEKARRVGDLAEARRLLADAAAVAARRGDADLAADVAQEIGRVLILEGRATDGMAMMEQAMLSAGDGKLSAYTTGKVYCCLMSACDDTGDVERLAQWRDVAAAWSAEHGLDVFPGMCRVHHAELLALLGRWPEAERAAQRACAELHELGWVVAYAYNTLGHLHRCRGDLDAADDAFHEAEARGTVSEHGLALVLLARGDADAALRRISRALVAVPSPALARVHMLPASVEVAIAAGDLDTARVCCAELDEIATAFGTTKFRAQTASARGRLALAAGEAASACVALEQALEMWTHIGAPYEVARTRVLQARVCRTLSDDDGCTSQLRIASATFTALGAANDLAEVDELLGRRHDGRGPLSDREVEVLRVLSTGATNKQIAAHLYLSEKTVSRHLGNIYTKIGTNTRAAATAYAYRTGIVGLERTPTSRPESATRA